MPKGMKFVLVIGNSKTTYNIAGLFEDLVKIVGQHNCEELARGYVWRIDLPNGGYIWRVR